MTTPHSEKSTPTYKVVHVSWARDMLTRLYCQSNLIIFSVSERTRPLLLCTQQIHASCSQLDQHFTLLCLNGHMTGYYLNTARGHIYVDMGTCRNM